MTRLKKAKQEAELEIKQYKESREAQFQIFSKERVGDSGLHSSELAKATEGELAQIAADIKKNEAKVIAMLLKSVTTVA